MLLQADGSSPPQAQHFESYNALLQHICKQRLLLQQQQQQQPPPCRPLLVGYLMKGSRQRQLGVAGLLPVGPSDGMAFMPLDIERPLKEQVGLALGRACVRGAERPVAGPLIAA